MYIEETVDVNQCISEHLESKVWNHMLIPSIDKNRIIKATGLNDVPMASGLNGESSNDQLNFNGRCANFDTKGGCVFCQNTICQNEFFDKVVIQRQLFWVQVDNCLNPQLAFINNLSTSRTRLQVMVILPI